MPRRLQRHGLSIRCCQRMSSSALFSALSQAARGARIFLQRRRHASSRHLLIYARHRTLAKRKRRAPALGARRCIIATSSPRFLTKSGRCRPTGGALLTRCLYRHRCFLTVDRIGLHLLPFSDASRRRRDHWPHGTPSCVFLFSGALRLSQPADLSEAGISAQYFPCACFWPR